MIRRFPFSQDDGKDDVKKRLNSWIEKQNLTEEETCSALEAILNQRKNIVLVKKNAKKAGLRLERFISNNVLEIYYDILIKDRAVGYISKGWTDPGFRVGEYFELEKGMSSFKEKFYKIFRVCSGNLVSLSVSEKTPRKIGVSLEIAIYKNGFNDKVLKEVVGTLESTMRKINLLLGDCGD